MPSELEVVQATPPAVQRKNSTSSTPLPRSAASATTVNGSASAALTKPRSTGVVKATVGSVLSTITETTEDVSTLSV